MNKQEVISSSKKLYEILHLSSFGTSVISIGVRLGLKKHDLDICFDYLLRNRLIDITDSGTGPMVYITARGMQVFKKISGHL